jgi:hypothetical protein
MTICRIEWILETPTLSLVVLEGFGIMPERHPHLDMPLLKRTGFDNQAADENPRTHRIVVSSSVRYNALGHYHY